MSEDPVKPRILAVDDSRVMRRAMTKILSKEYDVIEAENGEDAWTVLLNDDAIQIIFSDLSMPYLDGFGLLQRVRESDDQRINSIPVIIITGKDDDDDTKQDVLDKGANDFITKPFDSVQLQARAKAQLQFQQTTNKLNETSDKLERQATVDETTGLGGQRYFCKVGEEFLAYSKRHSSQFILLRMDIDNFNQIYIKNGKEVIDQILHEIGNKLSQLVRQEDNIARIGLAKFAMLIKSTQIDEAQVLAERVRSEISEMTFTSKDNDSLTVTVSIGLYEPEIQENDSFADLIKTTEGYLAEATDAGGNKIVSHGSDKPWPKDEDAPAIDLDIVQLLEKLKQNESEQLIPHVEAILQHMTPLLSFLVENARTQFQDVLKQISSKK